MIVLEIYTYTVSSPVDQINSFRWFNDTLEYLSVHINLSNADKNANGFCWLKGYKMLEMSKASKLDWKSLLFH